MAFCTKCGRSNEQQARFCNTCGAAMWGVTAPNQTVRTATTPTVIPRPQFLVVQGGIKSSGLAGAHLGWPARLWKSGP